MLCALCITLFQRSESSGAHHDDLANLTRAAENGCKICIHLLRSIQLSEYRDQGGGNGPSSIFLSYQFRRYSSYLRDNFGTLCLEFTFNAHEAHTTVYVHFTEIPGLTSLPKEQWQILGLARRDVGQEPWRVRRDEVSLSWIPDNTGGEATAAVAKRWLQDCIGWHGGRCRSVYAERDPTWCPKRLIYVGSSTEPPRLILPAQERRHTSYRYATLSHCWGKNPSFFMLTSDNHETLRGMIPFEALARSFRDAIVTCRRLELDYLWIDSLCILQSGEDAQKDWLEHANQMHAIYLNCELNIAIEHADNPDVGAFVSRNPDFLQDCSIPFPDATRGPGRWLYGTVFTPHDLNDTFSGTPLSRRGWVFQERLLSPRTLHFSNDRIAWECGDESHLNEYLRHSNTVRQEIMFPRHGGYNLKPPMREPWWSTLKRYTGTQLSHPTKDKLVAIAAIARICAPAFGGGYFAGMFRSTLPGSLLWVSFDPSRRRSVEYRAPSWSWASVDGEIALTGPGEAGSYEPLIQVDDVAVTLVDPHNGYGQVEFAELRIRGTLLPLVSTLEKNTDNERLEDVIEDSPGVFLCRYGPVNDINLCFDDATHGAECLIRTLPAFGSIWKNRKQEVTQEKQDQTLDVFFLLPVAIEKTRPWMSGLILIKHSDGVFTRAGTFEQSWKREGPQPNWMATPVVIR